MATATSHSPPGPSYQYPQAPPPQYQQQQQQQLLLPPPQQNPSAQQRSSQPSRKSRSFSFRSDKSHGSSNHNYKLDLTETSAEKEANRLHSKADPTLAMQEAEPAEVAAFVKSSLASLRNLQHKDIYGNPISEPDRSNPTRSRWERPLDTIRSFEAAIDGGYNNRRSMIRPDPDSSNNRRQSYYGGGSGTGGRFSHDSYYGSRPQSLMYADRVGGSHQDLRSMNHRDTYYDYQSGHNGHGPPPNSRQRWPRMQSEPQYGYNRQHQGEYTIPSNHRSYETVTTAWGSGTSGEPSGYHTDPTSSDNSSIERIHSAPKRQPEPMNDYGIGFSQSTPYQPPSFMVGTQSSGSSIGDLNNYQISSALNGSAQPPQPPKMDQRGSILRKPMAPTPVLTSTVDHVQRPSPPEKRKSWLSRRFSKTR